MKFEYAMLFAILVCYLSGILLLSIYASRRVNTEEDYVVAGRRLPLWMAWGTLLATWFGAATILGSAEAARSDGVRGTLLDPFASGIALIIAGLFFAKPLWEMKLLTMGDFYGRVYGPRAEMIASIVLVPSYVGWIGAQFIALGGLQETFLGIPAGWGIVIAAIIILFYTLIGGMWSVTMTDTLQLGVALVGVVILAVTVFGQLGDGSPVDGVARLFRETDHELLTFLPGTGIVATLAWIATMGSGAFGCIPGQDLMQRVFSSRDSKTAKRACVLAGIAYVAFGFLPVGMGLASRILVPNEDGGAILGVLASRFLTPTLTAVFVISLASVVISTATSAVLAPATLLGHNLLARLKLFRNRKLLADRVAVTAMVAGGVAMTQSGDTILGLLEMTVSVILVGLFVPLLMGIHGKPRSELSAILAVGFGSSVWLARELFEGVFVPMPDTLAESGLAYPDFIAAEFSAEAVGAIVSGGMYSFALVPSALSGVAASFVGYFIGQRLGRVRTVVVAD